MLATGLSSDPGGPLFDNIVDALRDQLAEMIRMDTEVQSLQPAGGAKWRLALNDGTTIEADA
jgi:protoporphyrinogen oxidase